MTDYKNLKKGAILTISSLAMAVSFSSQAYDFEVGDTTASIYGYVKLDVIADVDSAIAPPGADPLPLGVNTLIPLDSDPLGLHRAEIEGKTQLHAYQSRIGFKTFTPTDNGDLVTRIEGDFFGEGGGELRLRHAYGSWNGILAGQTWTNFGSILGMNRIIDFKPQAGLANGSRQAQLRYTTGGFSVAMEDPDELGGKVSDSTNPLTGAPEDHPAHKSSLPDLTLRYMGQVGNLRYGVSGLLRQLAVDDGDMVDDSVVGWGVNAEAEFQVTPAVTLRGSVTHGDGIGGYIEEAPAAPAYVDPATGNIETIKETGATAGIRVAVGSGHINLGYGYATADLDNAVDAGYANDLTNETMTDTHLNYVWSPMKNVRYGVEVSRQTREVVSGEEGDAVRLQGMVMYSF